jgi:hypothetical protein
MPHARNIRVVQVRKEGIALMQIAKQAADLLTFSRGLLLLLSWTTDALDGPLARRSVKQVHSWIGARDLEIDMAVSCGLLIYMVTTGLIDPTLAGIYALAWALIFWRWGVIRSLGMLVQAPIYGYFIWVAVSEVQSAGQWLIAWVIAALVITWPRFPRTIIPDFFDGLDALRHKK